MKAPVSILLAAVFILNVSAIAQEGGVKITPGQQNEKNMPMHDKAIIDEGTLKDLGTTGGGSGEYQVYEESSMYLEPGWEQGYVILKDKTMIDGIQLRYDLYHQQMQFIKGEDTLAFSRPEELNYLFIGDRKFIYTEYKREGIVKSGYFEVLHEGKCPLYLQRSVKYHLDPDTQTGLKHDVYVRECNYFVKKDGEMAQPVKACKKSILCAFKDKEEEVSRFMADNELTGKTCEDLKLVIAFYNSLP